DYQYGISDHQGNTRVVFSSSAGTAQPVVADMEDSSNNNFPNYGDISRNSFAIYNHTAGAGKTYSALLNGGYNGQIGLAKSYKVYPGDKLKIEGYAKWSNQMGTGSNLAGFATALLSAFGAGTPASGEVGTLSSGLHDYGAIVAAGNGHTSTGP